MAEIALNTLSHVMEEHSDGSLTIVSAQDVEPFLKAAAESRQRDAERGRELTKGSGLHFVGTIPAVVVQLWKDQGFDLHSPEQSGMTPEQHQREVLKRLSGDWAALNTSRYSRLA